MYKNTNLKEKDMDNEIKIKFINEYKSFKIGTEYNLSGNLILLSGINGAGKSQLLESINNQNTDVYINNQKVNNREIVKYSFKENISLPSFGKYDYELARQTDSSILFIYKSFVQAYKDFNSLKEKNLEKGMTEEKYYMNCISANISEKDRYGHVSRSNEISKNTIIEIINNIKEKNPENFTTLTDTEVLNSMPNDFIIKLVGEEIEGITRIFTEASRQRFLERNKYADVKEVFDNDKWLKTAPWTEINNLFKKLNFNYRFSEDFEYSIPFLKEEPRLYAFENNRIDKSKIREIDDLSDGEKAILKLVILSYDRKKDKTTKILLLDEYDATLNPSLIKDFYTVIQEYYLSKGIIVLLSTHSPTTLALAPDDTKFYEIFRQNDNSPIIKEVSSIEYEELKLLENYYDRIKNPSERLEKLKGENEKLRNIIKDLTTPLIVTEGKTDWKHIKNAKCILKNQDEYKFFETIDDMGDEELFIMLKEQAKIDTHNKRIFIFDNDNEKILKKVTEERKKI